MDFPKVHRIGKYGVDVELIDRAGDRLGLDPAEVYLVDEIGKMECLSDRFVSGMRALLAGPQPVVATIALHGSGFIEEVKRGEGAVIREVTHANREKLPVQVLGWLTGITEGNATRGADWPDAEWKEQRKGKARWWPLTAAVVPSPGQDHGDGVAHIGGTLTAFVHQQLVARAVFSRSHEDGL